VAGAVAAIARRAAAGFAFDAAAGFAFDAAGSFGVERLVVGDIRSSGRVRRNGRGIAMRTPF
jgi:hypothetical protein